ncbi:MAG: sigma-70 family RNA polymerase sigma factor [Planctomycetes bacterium]|nr:sigma-70 family RNA polymerase sigma factor [Planctomycetota bacterium]
MSLNSPSEHGDVDAELVELSRELRRFARHVARDEAAADDLVQDAWLAALSSRPGTVANLTTWLRGVVRNIARRNAARARVREHAERSAAAPEAGAAEHELSERASTYRALRDCFDTLREPSRTVLRMRYFDERSPAEIAAELGRPLETVRTQLQRGLAELRTALARRRVRDRSSWAAILLDRSSARPWFSRAVSATRWWLATAAMIAAVLLAWRLASVEPAALQTASLAPVSANAATTADLSLALDPGRTSAAPSAADQVPPAHDATRLLTVQVLDPLGRAVRDATIVLSGANELEVARTSTDADGRAAVDVTQIADVGPPVLPVGPRGILVEAFGAGWSYSPLTVVACGVGRTEVTLTLGGRAQRLVGQVRDVEGAPIPRAVVTLEPHVPGLRTGDDGRLYMESPAMASADDQGQFALGHLPRREHHYRIQAPGFGAQRGTIAGEEDELVLERRLQRGGELLGRVWREDGTVAAGARVWSAGEDGVRASAEYATASATGDFVLRGLSPGSQFTFACDTLDPTLYACEELEVVSGGSTDWSPTLRREDPLTIRVESGDGLPVAAAIVVLRVPADARSRWIEMGTADANGRIEFRHRPPVQLECFAMRPGTGSVPHSARIEPRASREIVLRLSEPAPSCRVRLRVEDAAGVSIPGARFVALAREAPLRLEAAIDGRTGEVADLWLPPGTYRTYVVGALGGFDVGIMEVAGHDDLVLPPISVAPGVPVAFDWTRAPAAESWMLQGIGVAVDAEDALEIGTISRGSPLRVLWPGRYRLIARLDDGSRADVRFEVSADAVERVVVSIVERD